MLAVPEFLIARPIPALLPVEDARGSLRVLIASLARGGAERIVLDWLDTEARRGRAVELAVVHPRRNAWQPRAAITLIERGGETPDVFVQSLARRWEGALVSTHLIDDALLAHLWRGGVRTVPTVHNSRDGWRNDPARWSSENVPYAIACAEAVRAEMLEAGCAVPVATIRHIPPSPRGATNADDRRAIRQAWNIGDDTLLIGTVGAFKPQKDFPRTIEVLAAVRSSRDAALVILGGVLDKAQLAELERTLDRVCGLGLQAHVKLPGFVDPIGAWYAACDVVLSASRYEGLSMAAREALAAGLPVVALDVGGQAEIGHGRLALLPAASDSVAVAGKIATCPVRERLEAESAPRAPRVWSVAHAQQRGGAGTLDTLFVTANLNAGGAQRSLVNLASTIATRHRFEVAVCGEATSGAFAERLAAVGVAHFRPAPTPDPFAIAESLLAHVHARAVRTLCFWNADPRVKLLVSKFAHPALRIVDASPGAYAFEEMAREREFAATIAYSTDSFYDRLDVLVLKHRAEKHPSARDVRVVPNGVAEREGRSRRPPTPRFVVSGRIAPSKHLETIIDAFAQVHALDAAAELHIVGQAEPRHARYAATLVAAANRLRIRFRGAVPGLEHLDEEFTAAIVLGTRQGCPNAVLEAMAAGIPVIANASGGTGELVRDGETGWLLAEAPHVDSLARAMSECAARLDLADAFAVKAREQVRRAFSLDAMAAGYLDCFRTVP